MTCPFGHAGPRLRDLHWEAPLCCGYCGRPLDEEWVVSGWAEGVGRLWRRRVPLRQEPPNESGVPGSGACRCA